MKRIIIIFTAVFLAGLFCGLAQGAKEEAGVEVLYNWDFKKGGESGLTGPCIILQRQKSRKE